MDIKRSAASGQRRKRVRGLPSMRVHITERRNNGRLGSASDSVLDSHEKRPEPHILCHLRDMRRPLRKRARPPFFSIRFVCA
jgi:hypothetical protein